MRDSVANICVQFDKATQAHLAEIRDMCEADCQALDAWSPKDTNLDSVTFEAYLRSRGTSGTARSSRRFTS